MKKRKKTNTRKRNQQIIHFAMVMIGVFLFYLGIKEQLISLPDTAGFTLKSSASDKVERYTPLLREELGSVQLEEYTPILAAVMQQESKGKGGDPMQASESAGLAPNTIKDPEQSIKQGVKHFQRALQYGEKKNVDLPTIIQAYNMGLGYIDFVAKNGGKHSEQLAKKFSSIQVQKNPSVYNCGRDKKNFRYPYCYGDFSYSTKVLKNLQASKQTLRELN